MDIEDIAEGIVILMLCIVIVGIPTFFLFVEAFKGNYTGPGDKKKSSRTRPRRRDNNCSFFDDGRRSRKSKQRKYDPFDNHWESSFDWKDKDNDGYDDRDDGF